MAVWPSDELTAQLDRIERPSAPGLRWTTPDQWHVTLLFLGDADLEGALGTVAAWPAATAVAGPQPTALNPRIWALPVEGLAPLAAAARAAFPGARPDHDFRGHLTLARARRGLPALAGRPLSQSWPVSEVTLVESTLDPAGATYSIAGRWAVGCGPCPVHS